MEAQEIFYIIASIALVVITVLVGFVFYVVYKINRIAQTSLRTLNFVSHDIRNSMAELAKNWGRITLAGLAFKLIKTFIRR